MKFFAGQKDFLQEIVLFDEKFWKNFDENRKKRHFSSFFNAFKKLLGEKYPKVSWASCGFYDSTVN